MPIPQSRNPACPIPFSRLRFLDKNWDVIPLIKFGVSSVLRVSSRWHSKHLAGKITPFSPIVIARCVDGRDPKAEIEKDNPHQNLATLYAHAK